jgi:hypothetical protein
VVPTRNEAGNVAPLLAGLQDALAGEHAEVRFVDSDDATPNEVPQLLAEPRSTGADVVIATRYRATGVSASSTRCGARARRSRPPSHARRSHDDCDPSATR